MARCVPFQAFRQVSVKEDNEEANIIEPRGGGKSLLSWNRRVTTALLRYGDVVFSQR